MANLPETATWEPGIYQLETTDPVLGGPNGPANTQAKQLANRTAFLKQQIDQALAGIGTDGTNALVGALSEALGLVGVVDRRLRTLQSQFLQQGGVVIKNKYVIQGFVLTKSDIRALHLSQTGTVGSGISIARIDGLRISLADDDYHVSVETNPTSAPITRYAYLLNTGDGVYAVRIGPSVPDAGLLLYQLTIPANDTANNLSAVTLTDQRMIQAENGWTRAVTPEAIVALAHALVSPAYQVALEVESATLPEQIGRLEVVDRQTNGFKVRMSGSADNVRLRYSVLAQAQR